MGLAGRKWLTEYKQLVLSCPWGLERGRKCLGFSLPSTFQSATNASSWMNPDVKQLTKETGRQPEESASCDKGQSGEREFKGKPAWTSTKGKSERTDRKKYIDIDCTLHEAWETTGALFICAFAWTYSRDHSVNTCWLNELKRIAPTEAHTIQHELQILPFPISLTILLSSLLSPQWRTAEP